MIRHILYSDTITPIMIRYILYSDTITPMMIRYILYSDTITPIMIRHNLYSDTITPIMITYVLYSDTITRIMVRHILYSDTITPIMVRHILYPHVEHYAIISSVLVYRREIVWGILCSANCFVSGWHVCNVLMKAGDSLSRCFKVSYDRYEGVKTKTMPSSP